MSSRMCSKCLGRMHRERISDGMCFKEEWRCDCAHKPALFVVFLRILNRVIAH